MTVRCIEWNNKTLTPTQSCERAVKCKIPWVVGCDGSLGVGDLIGFIGYGGSWFALREASAAERALSTCPPGWAYYYVLKDPPEEETLSEKEKENVLVGVGKYGHELSEEVGKVQRGS